MPNLLLNEKDNVVEKTVTNIQESIKNIVLQLSGIESVAAQALCYYSILESFAQESANYNINKQQKVIFSDFVIKYSSKPKYSFLELVDPVTLYYRKEKKLKTDITLNFHDGRLYKYSDNCIRDKAREIEAVLKRNNIKNIDKLLKEHRYIDLLYRQRCRLSHEFYASYFSESKNFDSPYYSRCSRSYMKDDKLTCDNVWILRIPIVFLKELCIDCVNNYLDECLKTNTFPYQNDGMDRLCELSWYNK